MVNITMISIWLNIILITFTFIALATARTHIKNGLKYMLLKRRGYVHFAVLDYSNKIQEFVAKAGGTVEHNDETFIHNERPKYRYHTGGNLYVMGKTDPLDVGKLRENTVSMSFDSNRFNTLLKRERSIGKLEGQKEDKKEYYILVFIAIVTLLGLLINVFIFNNLP